MNKPKYFRLEKRTGKNCRGFTSTFRFLVDKTNVVWGVFQTEKYAKMVENILVDKYEAELKLRGTFEE
jgi:hypothetical protein